jgi:hypothetical protein
MSFRWLYKAVGLAKPKSQPGSPILHAASPGEPINTQGSPQESAAMESAESKESQGQGEHCPFLNRSDHRCSQHFNLDQLDYALEHCFDKYQNCQTYFTLLNERQEKRVQAVVHQGAFRKLQGIRRNDSSSTSRLVQIKVPVKVSSKIPAGY